MQPMLLGKMETVTSALIYNATGRDITDVFVDGRQVVADRVLQTIDVKDVMEKVQKVSEKIGRALSS